VKPEDIDWKIYHIIAADESVTMQELTEAVDIPASEIEASVKRLERNFLIKRINDHILVCSIEESLLASQMRPDDSPVYIENGVIRVKPEYRR